MVNMTVEAATSRAPNGALITALPLRGVVTHAGSGVESLSACLGIPHVQLGYALAEAGTLAELDFVVVEGVPAADAVFVALAALPRRGRLVYWVEGRLGGLAGIAPSDARIQAQALAAADIVAVVNERTIPYYRLLTSAPVVWWGVPYYEHITRELALAPEQRAPDLVVLGASPSAAAKNALASALVAARCGLRVLTFGTAQDRDELATAGVDATVAPITDSVGAVRAMASARLAVHLDPRDTWGRFSLDCAAVGIPCVGSDRVDTQARLFPELTLDWLDGDGAVSLVKRLLSDRAFYDDAVTYARNQLPDFGFDAARTRILSTLNRS